MKAPYRAAACAALCFTCAALAACVDQLPPMTGRPGAIYIHEPKIPPGLAGPGAFTLSPDGKVTINGNAADSPH